MNLWLTFATVLLISSILTLVGCLRGKIMERFVSLQMAQVLAVLTILLMAEGFGRDIYFDLALTMAVLSFAASLVFVRFIERWL